MLASREHQVGTRIVGIKNAVERQIRTVDAHVVVDELFLVRIGWRLNFRYSQLIPSKKEHIFSEECAALQHVRPSSRSGWKRLGGAHEGCVGVRVGVIS